MVGREMSEIFPPRLGRPAGEPVLELRGLGDGRAFGDVGLTLRQGEILGIAGLVGSGREELIDTIFGLRRARAGQMLVKGRRCARVRPPRRSRRGSCWCRATAGRTGWCCR